MEQKFTVDHIQVENMLTFATVVVPQSEDWMLNRNRSAWFSFKTFLVPISSGYYIIEMADT